MSLGRRDFLKIAAAGPALAFGGKAPAFGGKAAKRVVILGFDGASPVLVRKWMDEGRLPNLKKLRESGMFSPITTANPPQTPVSWASFATGLNPGKTKLFDFLRRDLAAPNEECYWPTLALIKEGERNFLAGERNPIALGAGAFAAGGIGGLAVKAIYNVIRRRMKAEKLTELFDPRVLAAVAGISVVAGGSAGAFAGRYLPNKMPTITNGVQGQTFWQKLDDNGIPTTSFRVPVRFPADNLRYGRAVAGLGTPDVRATTGSYTYYTTEILAPDKTGDTEMGGIVIPLYFKPTTGETKTVVHGPRDKLFPEKYKGKVVPDRLTAELKLTATADSLEIRTDSWSGKLKPGEWSEPVVFTFRYNDVVKFEGFGRFNLMQLSPDVKLFLTPISFHPNTPIVRFGPVKISTPQSFIGELSDKHGLFKNYGWTAETNALNEENIPEELFLEDLYRNVEEYGEIMMDLLASDDPLLVNVFSFTDRVGHMFWHHMDPTHPKYDAAEAAKYSGEMYNSYKKMDDIVGDVVKALGNKAWFFILSDHGFHPFRYAVNYNTWLVKNGFMHSKIGSLEDQMTLEDLFGIQKKGRFWPNVDWSKTKAYAFGLGGIYINVKGRENFGIVEPKDYEKVKAEIIKGLESYVDPNTGEKPVAKVYRREDVYNKFDPNDMPDLRAGNNSGYRCSWQSSLGAIPPSVIDTNAKKWGGDHCSLDPPITKGIFFCNRDLPQKDPNLLDFYPTVLKLFGLDVPADRDGKSLV